MVKSVMRLAAQGNRNRDMLCRCSIVGPRKEDRRQARNRTSSCGSVHRCEWRSGRRDAIDFGGVGADREVVISPGRSVAHSKRSASVTMCGVSGTRWFRSTRTRRPWRE